MVIPTSFIPVLPSGEPLAADVALGGALAAERDAHRWRGFVGLRGSRSSRSRRRAPPGSRAPRRGDRHGTTLSAPGAAPRVTLPRALRSEALRLSRARRSQRCTSPAAWRPGLPAGSTSPSPAGTRRWARTPTPSSSAPSCRSCPPSSAGSPWTRSAPPGASPTSRRSPRAGAPSRRSCSPLRRSARARWPWRSACSGPCSPPPGACRSGPRRSRPPGRAPCWAACRSTRLGSRWPCASAATPSIGVGAAGTLLAFFSVGGLAHGLMTGELTGALATPTLLGPVCLARAPGVARGGGLHRLRTSGGAAPRDRARRRRARPRGRRRPCSPGSAASRTGGQMRSGKPLVVAMLALLSVALVLGGNALLEAGWGPTLRSVADRVLPNPEVTMWAPAPDTRKPRELLRRRHGRRHQLRLPCDGGRRRRQRPGAPAHLLRAGVGRRGLARDRGPRRVWGALPGMR